jgi:hypothetical protein
MKLVNISSGTAFTISVLCNDWSSVVHLLGEQAIRELPVEISVRLLTILTQLLS